MPAEPARRRPPLIAVDAMGGDHAPDEAVAGAVAAQREHGVHVVLVGRAPEVRARLLALGAVDEIPVVHAEDVLGMGEGAMSSWRRPRSSVAVACRLVRSHQAQAMVSAGSTGGIVATSTVRLRPQSGVLRPALAVALPTRPNPTVLLDAGANADAKPEMLVQFAHLGVAYAQTALGVAEPRVGILTIGTEPGKGNKLARKASELLADPPEAPADAGRLHFLGNVEGHDLLAGQVDVVVTDGFTGNVALKSVEGAVRFAFEEVRSAITSRPLARVGAVLQRGRLRELRERLDSDTYGGAALLGLNGTVVIAHGASRAAGVARACVLARDLAEGQITELISKRVGPHRATWLQRLNPSEGE
ncbi:phosphate:acyl-[acyl carrier protein] acyltransferase [Allonocardiopsis opalescens]|uniref:Phosphate acyltransferase n=2 Tax=Allonocardiopsis opalescens TaxID=1144618 RepID=A0A2T0Q9M0_9ACTN|nr:phosphate acyltransferase PlsX [Allonocardiopsis opalescens]PRY00568.1 phosphate:acyl-[acyl carrier protein] acyltransferase [Allonocardiopsis opalescens]